MTKSGVGGLGPVSTCTVGKGLVLFFSLPTGPEASWTVRREPEEWVEVLRAQGEERARSGDTCLVLLWEVCSVATLLTSGLDPGRRSLG